VGAHGWLGAHVGAERVPAPHFPALCADVLRVRVVRHCSWEWVSAAQHQGLAGGGGCSQVERGQPFELGQPFGGVAQTPQTHFATRSTFQEVAQRPSNEKQVEHCLTLQALQRQLHNGCQQQPLAYSIAMEAIAGVSTTPDQAAPCSSLRGSSAGTARSPG